MIEKIEKLFKDENGQGAAEYILLFGGVLVIAIAALLIYNSYFKEININSTDDVNSIRRNLSVKY